MEVSEEENKRQKKEKISIKKSETNFLTKRTRVLKQLKTEFLKIRLNIMNDKISTPKHILVLFHYTRNYDKILPEANRI